ncbi:MAG TPA: hypothetical protein VF189_04840 [Patescibacteria group bacterium]
MVELPEPVVIIGIGLTGASIVAGTVHIIAENLRTNRERQNPTRPNQMPDRNAGDRISDTLDSERRGRRI